MQCCRNASCRATGLPGRQHFASWQHMQTAVCPREKLNKTLLPLALLPSSPLISILSLSLSLSSRIRHHEFQHKLNSDTVSIPSISTNDADSHDHDRFRCKVGGEWKDISAFSNAQQRNLKYNSKGIDAAHSGMTCKEHSAGSRAELRCELCRLVKPIDEFSKSSRRKGEYVSRF